MMTMTSASVTTPTGAIHGNVHVTGRRVVATIIDGFVIGGIYAAMAAMFGTITTDTGVRPRPFGHHQHDRGRDHSSGVPGLRRRGRVEGVDRRARPA